MVGGNLLFQRVELVVTEQAAGGIGKADILVMRTNERTCTHVEVVGIIAVISLDDVADEQRCSVLRAE